jgi:nucleoredoxin
MRTFISMLVAFCVVSAVAASRPLTNKEIALMLRSGFSSDTVLREIAERHVLEPLDLATRKSLVEFGASNELISALEKNLYRASASQVEQANASVNANRPAPPPVPVPSAPPPVNVPAWPQDNALATSLRGKLMICRDGTITAADDSALENKKLIALYFSGHWCPPCRKFTPQLVDYYNQVEAQHPEFEIVFVSCDRSRFNWETYMRDTRMPWPAVDYDRLGELGDLRRIGGDGIPSLVLVDPAGHVLSSSFEGEKYLGPQKVIADLERIFAATTPSLAAQVP